MYSHDFFDDIDYDDGYEDHPDPLVQYEIDMGFNMEDYPENVVCYLEEAVQELQQKGSAVPKNVNKLFAAAVPKLSVPATREECIEGFEKLKLAHRAVFEKLKPTLMDHIDHVQLIIEQCDKYADFLDALKGDDGEFHPTDLHTWSSEVYDHKYDLESMLGDAELEMRQLDTPELLIQMQRMLEGQTKELKYWFLVDHNEFSAHLHEKEKKQALTMHKPAQRPLPMEISALIYSYCDLETCISLREASTFWYTSFQHSDSLLEANMRSRNPWMEPEGEMKTWGDCILVHVARLRQWKILTDKNELKIDENEKKEKPTTKITMATPLQYREKLPTSFKPFAKHTNDTMECYNCLYFHEEVFGDDKRYEKTMSPWTFEKEQFEESQIEIVSSNETETVIKSWGYEITLPGKDHKFSRGPYGAASPVLVRQHTVVVRVKEGPDFVFPKDKLHYKYAARVEAQCFVGKEIGGVFMVDDAKIRMAQNPIYSYSLFDSYHGKMHDYISTEVDPTERNGDFMLKYYDYQVIAPVAVYCGQVYVIFNGWLLPSFMDLHTHKVYYNRDKAIQCNLGELKQYHFSCGARRFLYAPSKYGVYLVDLESREITNVQSCSRGEGDRMYVGYEEGRFMARCLAKKSWWKLQGEM